MTDIITLVKAILPVLILSAAAIYIFHEYIRYQERREFRLKSSQGPVAQGSGADYAADLVAKPVQLTQMELQAAERFALYLERIAPDRLVMRLHQNGMSARMLQSEMLRAIREEFDHNLSQQIYLSETSWALIREAKEEMVTFVTKMGDSMKESATGIELSRKIFETASRVHRLPTDIALTQLRKDSHALLKGGLQ